jgi:hypothetical protein|eukprot:31562-Pelagococcus_subviridis.AAC.5
MGGEKRREERKVLKKRRSPRERGRMGTSVCIERACLSYEPLPMSVYRSVCTSWFLGNVYVRTASAVPVVVT